MSLLLSRLNTPFARKCGAVIVFVTVILFIANPELLSVVLLVNTLGLDVFVLLVGMQLRLHWSTLSTFVVAPCWRWLKMRVGG